MYKKSIFALGIFLFIFYSFAQTVLAENDYYVNSYYLYQGIGSKEQPFNKISQAVEMGAKNIYVANGIYEEDVTFNNANLIGEDREKTIIKGKIIIEGDSRLENASVILEKKLGDEWYLNEYLKNEVNIWVSDKSNVTIKNIFVSGGRIGIETDGVGQFNLENSKVTKTAKAVYIKKGRDINIINSEISGNYEEGIDLRDRVRGFIVNNDISNNDLSGIEVVVGYDELEVLNNIISNNGNSGITLQYYVDADEIGKFKINNNTISGNNKNAIICNRPRGGSPGGSYWSNSIEEMRDNLMYDNGELSFASGCKFSDEMKFNALKAETLDGEIEKGHYKFFTDEVDRQITQTAVQNRSKVKTFFIGSDYERLKELNEKIESYKTHVNGLNELSQQIENQGLIELLNKDKEEIGELNKSIEEFIVKERNKFSLFGWLFD